MTAIEVNYLIAALAVAVAVVQVARPPAGHRWWSRWRAAVFPLAIAAALLLETAALRTRAETFDLVMFARFAAFWAIVTSAPGAVGQVVGLRPPRWLWRAHLGLGAVHLALFATTSLVYQHPVSFRPALHSGPLTSVLLIPVAALAGWWLLAVLERVPTAFGTVAFAIGGSGTALALVIAALVVNPQLADHFTVVGYLPVLGATVLVQLSEWAPNRRRRALEQ